MNLGIFESMEWRMPMEWKVQGRGSPRNIQAVPSDILRSMQWSDCICD